MLDGQLQESYLSSWGPSPWNEQTLTVQAPAEYRFRLMPQCVLAKALLLVKAAGITPWVNIDVDF
jgi:hypothetical protein